MGSGISCSCSGKRSGQKKEGQGISRQGHRYCKQESTKFKYGHLDINVKQGTQFCRLRRVPGCCCTDQEMQLYLFGCLEKRSSVQAVIRQYPGGVPPLRFLSDHVFPPMCYKAASESDTAHHQPDSFWAISLPCSPRLGSCLFPFLCDQCRWEKNRV